jgi:hypothetical protein
VSCSHKTYRDHTSPVRTADGALVWRCSTPGCAAAGPWSDGFEYFGNIECRSCWLADIEKVSCAKCRGRSNATGGGS